MKKLLISCKRLTWAMVLGGTLLMGASACSKGEDAGEVNVEEGEFKERVTTEENPDNGNPQNQADSTYDEIYDRQEEKSRDKNPNTKSAPGVGATGNTPTGN